MGIPVLRLIAAPVFAQQNCAFTLSPAWRSVWCDGEPGTIAVNSSCAFQVSAS